jgi:hypothetical protein
MLIVWMSPYVRLGDGGTPAGGRDWDLELVKAVVMVQSWSTNQILQADMAEIIWKIFFPLTVA